MNTIDAIKSRRSIKLFDPDHFFTAEEESELLSLAMLSPTAFNIQNWRFVVVRDQELREQIRDVSWGQSQVTDSSLFIIICADLKAWKKNPRRYWANAGQDIQDFVLPAIDDYYRNKDQVQRDEAFRSCGIAAQTLMLAAKDLGYDSCPIPKSDIAIERGHSLPRYTVDKRCCPGCQASGRIAASFILEFGAIWPIFYFRGAVVPSQPHSASR